MTTYWQKTDWPNGAFTMTPVEIGGPVITPTQPEPPPAPVPESPRGPAAPVQGSQMGNASAIQNLTLAAGEVKSYQIPYSPHGSGRFQIGPLPGTPTEMDAELTISPSPGDVNYYKQRPYLTGRGGEAEPYRVIGGLSQGLSIRWGPQMEQDVAQVSMGGNWYLNVRYFANATGQFYYTAE